MKESICSITLRTLSIESREALREFNGSGKDTQEAQSPELQAITKQEESLDSNKHSSQKPVITLCTGIRTLIRNLKQSYKFKTSSIFAQLVFLQDQDHKFRHSEQVCSIDRIEEPPASMNRGSRKLKWNDKSWNWIILAPFNPFKIEEDKSDKINKIQAFLKNTFLKSACGAIK